MSCSVGNFEMNRAFLVDTLKRQGIMASVGSTPEGLRFEYITPDGIGLSIGELSRWPALKLKGLDDQKWAGIREKINAGSLTHDDMKGTEMFYLFEDFAQGKVEALDFFKGMLNLPETMDYDIFCLLDMETPGAIPLFFNDEDSFMEAFAEQYCTDPVHWDELDEDYMRDILERLEIDFGNFQYMAYS